jgi:ABC-type transport system involved in multi-copper enzyme maturation permease subunit
MVGFLYLFAEIPNIEPNAPETAEFGSYLDVMLITSVLSMASFCVLSAVMFSKFVIEEYTGKRAILLFTYPISRRKILMAKVIFVSAFTLVGFLISTAVVFATFSLTEYFSPIVKEGVMSDAIRQVAVLIGVEAVLAVAIGLIALFLGFVRKSVPTAIVTAVVLCSPVSNAGTPLLMAIAAAAAVIIAAVMLGVLSGKVNAMEV